MSMSENRCCENCHHISCLDTDNIGLCIKSGHLTCRDDICNSYIPNLKGWVGITPDNVEELYDKPIVVAWKYDDRKHYRLIGNCCVPPEVMAKDGGFYYYVVPELKIE